MSYAVRFLFGNVPRLLSSAMLLAVAALRVITSAEAQNATITQVCVVVREATKR